MSVEKKHSEGSKLGQNQTAPELTAPRGSIHFPNATSQVQIHIQHCDDDYVATTIQKRLSTSDNAVGRQQSLRSLRASSYEAEPRVRLSTLVSQSNIVRETQKSIDDQVIKRFASFDFARPSIQVHSPSSISPGASPAGSLLTLKTKPDSARLQYQRPPKMAQFSRRPRRDVTASLSSNQSSSYSTSYTTTRENSKSD